MQSKTHISQHFFQTPTATLIFVFGILNVGLIFVDRKILFHHNSKQKLKMQTFFFLDIHFQYNAFLFGFVVLSILMIQTGHVLIGALLFAVLLNFKHLYIYYAPVYFIYLLRTYCFESGNIGLGPSLRTFSISNLIKLGLVVVSVFCASLLPIVLSNPQQHLTQLLSRLFPFKRGLSHSYWAPNFWVFYTLLDKSLTHFCLTIGKKYFQKHLAEYQIGFINFWPVFENLRKKWCSKFESIEMDFANFTFQIGFQRKNCWWASTQHLDICVHKRACPRCSASDFTNNYSEHDIDFDIGVTSANDFQTLEISNDPKFQVGARCECVLFLFFRLACSREGSFNDDYSTGVRQFGNHNDTNSHEIFFFFFVHERLMIFDDPNLGKGYLILSSVGHFSLFPLLFEARGKKNLNNWRKLFAKFIQ